MNKIKAFILRRKTAISYGTAALVLTGILGFLVYKTRAVDIDEHNQVIGLLRQLKEVDSAWNVDVLRAKTGLDSNYDAVASPLALIEALDDALRHTASSFWGKAGTPSDKMVSLLATYQERMSQKISMIESFKSQNSILKNSSRFLPVAAKDLLEANRASRADGLQKERIENLLNDLLTTTMTYSLTPDAASQAVIESEIAELSADTATLDPTVQERVQILIAHVKTVLKQQLLGNQLLKDLSALPTAAAIDGLSDEDARENQRALLEQQLYGRLLAAYSAALLALVAYFSLRLFRSYRVLNRTNEALNLSNRELKESQVQLVQSEKMSALGQMVAGIAHEINTPLAYVKGTIDVLSENLSQLGSLVTEVNEFSKLARYSSKEKDLLRQKFLQLESTGSQITESDTISELLSLLKDGSHGISEISEIVLNLKNFSRLDREKVGRFSAEAGIESTLLLARNILKGKAEIRREFSGVPEITCSPSQINQVLLNLISNAAQAMPEHKDGGLIICRTALENENTIRIEIEDNGSGIPKEVLPKIFDPFFTTKPIGKGTGMGLSISYKIIQEHGGRIEVDSEQGIGTIFTIYLPIGNSDRESSLHERRLRLAA